MECRCGLLPEKEKGSSEMWSCSVLIAAWRKRTAFFELSPSRLLNINAELHFTG